MLWWHSILPLQTKWNFVELFPMVWSFRKRSQASGCKTSLETLLIPILIAVLRYVVALHTHSCWDHGVNFWRFIVGRAVMERKLGAVPIPNLKSHVTVIYGNVPSVGDYRACQDSCFSFWDFALLDYGNRNWYSWCLSRERSLILLVCASRLVPLYWT